MLYLCCTCVVPVLYLCCTYVYLCCTYVVHMFTYVLTKLYLLLLCQIRAIDRMSTETITQKQAQLLLPYRWTVRTFRQLMVVQLNCWLSEIVLGSSVAIRSGCWLLYHHSHHLRYESYNYLCPATTRRGAAVKGAVAGRRVRMVLELYPAPPQSTWKQKIFISIDKESANEQQAKRIGSNIKLNCTQVV